MTEPTLFELSSPGRKGVTFPEADVPHFDLPDSSLLRDDLPLPELAEVDVVRHYMALSRYNYSVDGGFYPLGSCTMKYNPKINEDTCRLPGFLYTHPLQPIETVQGNLMLMYQLQEWLKEISGFAAVTLQPAAGAHGEFTGVLMMRALPQSARRPQAGQDACSLIPRTGTQPGLCRNAGHDRQSHPSDARGNVDLDALRAECDDTVEGMMLTNPNTLGLFDEHIEEVIRLVHECGGLMYGDGGQPERAAGHRPPGQIWAST